MSDKELLALIFRKGVAVGMIRLLKTEQGGGVNEYNDFIGDPDLYLTQEEYEEIAKRC